MSTGEGRIDHTLESEDGQYTCGANHAVDVAYTVSCVESVLDQADILNDWEVRTDTMGFLLKYLRGDLDGSELRDLVAEIATDSKLYERIVQEAIRVKALRVTYRD